MQNPQHKRLHCYYSQFAFFLSNLVMVFASEQYLVLLKLESMWCYSTCVSCDAILSCEFQFWYGRQLFASSPDVFVMCNLWMHHGNYILLQFSRMASIVFTCSNFWIGQNTTAVPLKRIDTLISLNSMKMNHSKYLHAFGTNEMIWLEKTFKYTISLSRSPY